MRTTRVLGACVAALVPLASPRSQVDWWPRYPVNTPISFYLHGSYYAPGLGILAFDDAWALWSYDGDWRQLSGPAPFVGGLVSSAWDQRRGRLVVCSGQSWGYTRYPGPIDVWEWDGVSWSRLTSAGPPSRGGFRLVYLPRRQRVVLFGGAYDEINYAGGGRTYSFPDLWEWNGAQWQWVPNSGITVPGNTWPLIFSTLAYDEQRDRLVTTSPQQRYGMVGNGPLNVGFEWDGSGWTAVAPMPMRMNVYSLHYDTFRATLAAMGTAYGVGASNQVLTYEKVEVGPWSLRSPATMPASSGPNWFPFPLAYDAVRHVAVSYDRTFTTWEYGTTRPARVLSFGSGCGSLGPLTLDRMPHSWPWLGNTFSMALGPVPVQLPVMLAVEPTPLGGPVTQQNLAPLGMAGCFQYVWRPVMLPPTIPDSPMTLILPASPSWAGAILTLQAMAVDPAANAAGLITSNALVVTLAQLERFRA